MEKQLIEIFPREYRKYWERVCGAQDALQEIRLRVQKPVSVILRGREWFLTERGEWTGEVRNARCVPPKEIQALLQHLCDYSPYAYEEELKRGFLTLSGGHRVGVSGQIVLDSQGGIRTMKNISSVNIRIAHQVKGAADSVLGELYRDGMLCNTLFVSPPGCGKTTLLRDVIRQVSDGNRFAPGVTVGVVDERSELAGTYLGIPQNDLGIRTDVLDACPKEQGMHILLRSMAPRVIAIDELGNERELEALLEAAAGGCKVLATAHGLHMEDVKTRFSLSQEKLGALFELSVILGREEGNCVVKRIERIG